MTPEQSDRIIAKMYEINADQMNRVVDWFSDGHATKRATINKRLTSYGIKHVIERDTGVYISNDSCVAALITLGFRAQQVRGTPNYRFNIHVFKEQQHGNA